MKSKTLALAFFSLALYLFDGNKRRTLYRVITVR